ncbi:MAG TPA: DUF3667 domain-containing protein [Rhizomicrobium sp.]|nr:DUF3667 domain-containing protein [Rhizomicrobium sp.]
MTGDVEAILETGAAAAVEAAASALAERGTATGTCVNCRKPLLGPYCAVCGQPSVTGRRSVHQLVYAFVKDVVNFDSRVLRTTRALLFQPGELPAAFRRGQTQPYVPAIRLYLFVSLVFFVLLGVTHMALIQFEVIATPVKVIWQSGKPYIANPAYDKNEDDPDVRKFVKPLIPISKEKALRPGGLFNYSSKEHYFSRIGAFHSSMPPAARAQLLGGPTIQVEGPGRSKSDWVQNTVYTAINRLVADPAALNGPVTNWLPRALFLLLPLYALLLGLFHMRRRKDYFLVDHLVFSFSIHTFAFVALMIGVALAQFLSGDTVAWLFFGTVSLYIFVAMKRFYAQGWFLTAVKFAGVSAVYTLFCLLPALVGVLALSVFGVDLG